MGCLVFGFGLDNSHLVHKAHRYFESSKLSCGCLVGDLTGMRTLCIDRTGMSHRQSRGQNDNCRVVSFLVVGLFGLVNRR